MHLDGTSRRCGVALGTIVVRARVRVSGRWVVCGHVVSRSARVCTRTRLFFGYLSVMRGLGCRLSHTSHVSLYTRTLIARSLYTSG